LSLLLSSSPKIPHLH